MSRAPERRRFWRATFHAPVTLADERAECAAQLEDISLHGALLEVPDGWGSEVGSTCRFTVRLGSSDGPSISMSGRVRHREGRHVGVECESIDLDSITHLRRLVELNSGDPSLLETELAALIHG
ncbi:MAG: PilZ domain-containing protein [Myxococcota bacterium]